MICILASFLFCIYTEKALLKYNTWDFLTVPISVTVTANDGCLDCD